MGLDGLQRFDVADVFAEIFEPSINPIEMLDQEFARRCVHLNHLQTGALRPTSASVSRRTGVSNKFVQLDDD